MSKIQKNYHDCYIIGLLTDLENDSLELKIKDDNGQFSIIFKGVKRCRVDNFVIGNIILDLKQFSGYSDAVKLKESDAFKSLFYLSQSEKERDYFETLLGLVADEKLSYVEITPSYGCSAMIICNQIEEGI